MTSNIAIDMPNVIRKLARIHDDHQLEQLMLDWSVDCRGLTNDSGQLFTASELHRVACVTKALVQMCELPAKEVEPLVRALLLDHPRRKTALAMINEYARDIARADEARNEKTAAGKFDKLRHERGRQAPGPPPSKMLKTPHTGF